MSEATRMFGRRTLLKGSLALAAAPAIIGSARADTQVTWKVQAHWPKASGSFNDSLGVLAKQLEERTGGRFKMELYGAGEIAKDREIYNVVKRGVVPMGTISPGYILGEAQAMGLGDPELFVLRMGTIIDGALSSGRALHAAGPAQFLQDLAQALVPKRLSHQRNRVRSGSNADRT